ncbi:MAG: signal recognition particle protein [Chloroflexi bacterium]|nr:signal recognition particle protein [Chloroflexota bacterium]
MFDALSDKLQAVFDRLGRKGRVSEKDVDEALREVRLALLEADVHFRVVRALIERVRERAVGTDVLQSLLPAQQVVKIVHEELTQLLGEPGRLATASTPPTVIMLVGLQGSGKTTTAAKLAVHFKKQGQHPLLGPADPYRPSAIEQLSQLGKQVDVPVYLGPERQAEALCRAALQAARTKHLTPLILDTAGRLQTNDDLMGELVRIRDDVKPSEVLLVADSTIGQEALKVAQEFHSRVGLTGLILTKLDGDARGGAALSVREVTGVPLKFIGIGETLDAMESFHPERMASRILGMGDILTLIERAQETVDAERVQAVQRKLRSGTFDLEDFLEQLRQVQRMGPIDQVLSMIPGLGRQLGKANENEAARAELRLTEAVILSMTPHERRNPELIGGSRRRRIAKGSGTSAADVNRVLSQFRQIQQLMRRSIPANSAKRNIDLTKLFH